MAVVLPPNSSHFPQSKQLPRIGRNSNVGSKPFSVRSEVLNTQTRKAQEDALALRFVEKIALNGIEFEHSPDRQAKYACLADKETCKKILSSPKAGEGKDIQVLRSYFRQYPVNLLGLIHNRKALTNILHGIGMIFDQQLHSKIKQPMTLQLAQEISNLIMAKSFFDAYSKDFLKKPTTFLKEINIQEKLLEQALRKDMNKVNHSRVLFGGDRENSSFSDILGEMFDQGLDYVAKTLNIETRKGIAEKHAIATGVTSTLVSSALNVGLTGSIPIQFGVFNSLISYAKMAKSATGHSEIPFYGTRCINNVFKMFERKPGRERERWEREKPNIRRMALKNCLPWQRMVTASERSESFLNSSKKVNSILRSMKDNYEDMCSHSSAYKALVEQVPVKETFSAFKNSKQAAGLLESMYNQEHPLFNVLENGLRMALDTINVDEAIPVIGCFTSAFKGWCIYTAGNNAAVKASEGYSPSRGAAEETESLMQAYTGFRDIADNQIMNAFGFLKKYATDLKDYIPRNVWNNLMRQWRQQGNA